MRILFSILALQRAVLALGTSSIQTKFTTTEPWCETNIIYSDATSETCSGNAFQHGESCVAECKETVTLTCSCLETVESMSFLLIAKQEGCTWEVDKDCEVNLSTQEIMHQSDKESSDKEPFLINEFRLLLWKQLHL